MFVPKAKPSSEFVFNDDRQIKCQSVILFKIFIQFRHECYTTRVYFRNLIVLKCFHFFTGYFLNPRQIVKNESFVAFRLCRSVRCVHDSRYCRRFVSSYQRFSLFFSEIKAQGKLGNIQETTVLLFSGKQTKKHCFLTCSHVFLGERHTIVGSRVSGLGELNNHALCN